MGIYIAFYFFALFNDNTIFMVNAETTIDFFYKKAFYQFDKLC